MFFYAFFFGSRGDDRRDDRGYDDRRDDRRDDRGYDDRRDDRG